MSVTIHLGSNDPRSLLRRFESKNSKEELAHRMLDIWLWSKKQEAIGKPVPEEIDEILHKALW